MTSLVSFILYPALRLLLVSRLQKAIGLLEEGCPGVISIDLRASNTTAQSHATPDATIGWQGVRDDTQLAYLSALPLKLASHCQSNPVDMAEAIVANLLDSIKVPNSTAEPLDSTALIWQSFRIQVVPPGFIHFQLREEGWIEWLQRLVNQPLDSNQLSNFRSIIADPTWAPISSNSTHSFNLLYTHARCCSLLRSGVREGAIGLSPLEQPGRWLLTTPQPLPWRNPDRCLRCQHRAERQLVVQLAKTLDELTQITASTRLSQGLKLAQALVQCFQAFESTCRIFGQKTAALELVQTRLGLVFLTQVVLRSLLQDWLGLPAPAEF